MGFKNGAYATVWATTPGKTDNQTRVRLTTSRKNKKTDKYEQDFGSFCTFFGEASGPARMLKELDRIKLNRVEVTNNWDKESGKTWTEFKVFEFEMADGSSPPAAAATPKKPQKKAALLEEGDTGDMEDELPF